MKNIRRIRQLILTLFICLGLGLAAQSQAAGLNSEVQKLDNKGGKCPCFDNEDVEGIIEGEGNAICRYSFDIDRRLQIIIDENVDDPDPQQKDANAYVRRNLACYGPKVKPGTGTGLPGVGSFALAGSKEGDDCFNILIQAANKANISCKCVTQEGGDLVTLDDCPDSL